jgi:hypothetical protein
MLQGGRGGWGEKVLRVCHFESTRTKNCLEKGGETKQLNYQSIRNSDADLEKEIATPCY